jgi:hypothetical protein
LQSSDDNVRNGKNLFFLEFPCDKLQADRCTMVNLGII